MKMILSGAAIGLIAALALTRAMRSMLFGVGMTDPVTFASVALLITVAALCACFLPARRAMKVNPIIALRDE